MVARGLLEILPCVGLIFVKNFTQIGAQRGVVGKGFGLL